MITLFTSRRTALALALASTTGLTLLGCGSSVQATRPFTDSIAPAGPPERLQVERPFFVPGEQMKWKMSLRGVGGGVAVLMVGQPGRVDGRPLLIVRSRVETTGLARVIREVSDDVLTWVGLDSSLPIYYQASLKFGRKETSLDAHFDFGSFYINWQRKGKPKLKRRQRMPPDEHVHNAHSLLGALRAWTPAAGTRAYAYVLSGRRLWRTDIRMEGRELVRTGRGALPAIRYTGFARRMTSAFTLDRRKKPRTFTVWIAEDATRAPLLVEAHTEYGNLRVELTEYRGVSAR